MPLTWHSSVRSGWLTSIAGALILDVPADALDFATCAEELHPRATVYGLQIACKHEPVGEVISNKLPIMPKEVYH